MYHFFLILGFEAGVELPVVMGGQGGRVVSGCRTCEALIRVFDSAGVCVTPSIEVRITSTG